LSLEWVPFVVIQAGQISIVPNVGTEPDAVPRHEDSDSFPRFHVNAMRAWGGPFDITLDFGYRADPEIEPATQVRLSMSWEHVAATVKVLQVLVDGYEEQAGNLPDLEKLRLDDEEESQ
jgi:hypothetical protein